MSAHNEDCDVAPCDECADKQRRYDEGYQAAHTCEYGMSDEAWATVEQRLDPASTEFDQSFRDGFDQRNINENYNYWGVSTATWIRHTSTRN